MKKTKKVAVYLPFNKKNTSKKSGFLNEKEVSEVEKNLSSAAEIEFAGNVDFSEVKIVRNEFWCGEVLLNDLDLFFWYAPGMKKYMGKIRALSRIVRVMKSPQSYELVADKFLAHSYLKNKGLPVVDFALIRYDDFRGMKKIIERWKTVVVKPRRGSFGRGIIKISDFETLRDIAGFIKFETKQEDIFVERFYDNPIEEWISTTIIGGKVIYGYRKKKEKFADWKVYDVHAKGGGAYYVDPAPVKKIAEEAASNMDQSIVGFDFIKTNEGYRIVDENNFPGFYPEAFRDAGKNVSELISDLIIVDKSPDQ